MTSRYILPTAAAAVTCHPFYVAISLALDCLHGGQWLATWLSFDSKHALLSQAINDAVTGFPCGALVAAILTLAGLVAWQHLGRRLWLGIFVIVMAVVSAIVATLGFAPLQTLIVDLSLISSMLIAALVYRRLNHARAR